MQVEPPQGVMPQASVLDRQDERLRQTSGLTGAIDDLVDRVRGGDVGSLSIIVGLVIIAVIFWSINPIFLAPENLVNLLSETAAVGTIAIGIVLVLLVGQIDLSVGSMSGVASSILGVALTQLGWPVPVAIGVAVVVGLAVGVTYGLIFTRFGVPTFVITLAGLLALLGLQLRILGTNGSINIPFRSPLVEFSQKLFLPESVAYGLAAAIAGVFVADAYLRSRRRARAGLSARPFRQQLMMGVAILLSLATLVWYLYQGARGISLSFTLFVSLVVLMNLLLLRTRWGRSVYAVGGSVEAARRAGINVNRVYISVLALCSMFAAIGGVLAAGRLATASISSGTGDTNLNAIAAAVIGGTSLFGGRGGAYSALLGIIVIAAISNGLTLLSLDSSARLMITGAVLMSAVIVDSVSHRSRIAHGRA